MDHDPTHHKKETQCRTLPVLQEPVDMREMTDGADDIGGGGPEKVEADAKKDRVQNARYKDPFPQLVFADKMVCFHVRLECYDDLFEQKTLLFVYFNRVKRTLK